MISFAWIIVAIYAPSGLGRQCAEAVIVLQILSPILGHHAYISAAARTAFQKEPAIDSRERKCSFVLINSDPAIGRRGAGLQMPMPATKGGGILHYAEQPAFPQNLSSPHFSN
jgi:hypothetical protein